MMKKDRWPRVSGIGAVVLQAMMPLFLVGAATAGSPQIELEIYCPMDVDADADRDIDAFDLAVVADSYGECDPDCTPGLVNPIYCRGDINRNCFVGALDMAHMQSRLGPCPCLGDLDDNDHRDMKDVELLETLLIGQPLPVDCLPDVDHNGRVDHFDELAVRLSMSEDPDADPLRADVDDNGWLDNADLVAVGLALGRDCSADLNHDGKIDLTDRETLYGLLDVACP